MIPRTLGLFFCVLAAGCAGDASMSTPAPAAAEGVVLKPAETIAVAPPAPVAPVAPAAPVPAKPAAAIPEPAQTAAVAPEPPKAVPAAPPPKPAAAATPAAKPAPTTLDLTALETRLKNTKAIGVFTKLTLKNQVDDLLDQVRAMHQNKGKPSPSQVRQAYDLLLLKVLSLLQDGDPPLANAVASSREPLWGVLSDPVKFASIN